MMISSDSSRQQRSIITQQQQKPYGIKSSPPTLPPHFIESMRILFDVLDTDRTGSIRFDELSRRWRNLPPNAAPLVPPGFIDCLRRVSAPSGMLTFDRFCTGLRLALVNNNNNNNGSGALQRVASEGHLIDANNYYETTSTVSNGGGAHPTKHHHHHHSPPTHVVPMGMSAKQMDTRRLMNGGGGGGDYENYDSIMLHAASTNNLRMRPPPTNGVDYHHRRAIPPPPPPTHTNQRLADGSSPPRIPHIIRPVSAVSSVASSASTMPIGDVRWRQRSGREAAAIIGDQRRHTMIDDVNRTNGSGLMPTTRTVKHERLLEEERDMIKRGCETATKLLNWYAERMTSLEKRAALLEKGMVALDTAVHEQKLNYLRAHVTEVNRRMTSLMESSERGFPTHLNLEVRSQLPQPNDDQLTWLHRQNRQLTQELAEKSKLIEQLKLLEHHQQQPMLNDRAYSTNYALPQQQLNNRPAAYVRPAIHKHQTDAGHLLISAGAPQPTKPLQATLM